jgi:alkylation response protein AidB-like acyl-CoA dehydrogenase
MNAADSDKLLKDVDGFCRELRPSEELCYVERRFNDQVIPLAKKFNILAMPIPIEFGGRGADAVTYARALSRIGQEGTGVRTFFSGHISIGQLPILAWGNVEQKQRYLPRSARGEITMAFGLTEPDAGSNPLEMTTTYERRGNRFALSGVKYLISNGGIADVIVAFAYPKDVSADGKRRMSAFIVETKGDSFAKEDMHAKMGMPTANTAMFEMTGHEVPAANMLGNEGDGFRIAMHSLISGRLSVAAGSLGVIVDCLDECIAYAKERKQHGKEIAKHQLVQEHIAMIEMHRVTSEGMVMAAAAAKQDSDDNPADEKKKAQADLLVAEAKLHVSNAAWDAADRAVQLFGGRGWSTLYRVGRHLMDVRVCRIYEGTDEILKLKIAAAVLGKDFQAFK